MALSNEFRVGVLTLSVLAAVAWAIARTDDKPGDGGENYLLHLELPTAEGVFKTTPVRVAGVIVGHVEALELKGNTASVTLSILENVQIPVDSMAALRSEGMLGDKSVRIVVGSSDAYLQNGDVIKVGDMPPDLEKVTRQVDAIAGDVKVITGNIRDLTEDEVMRQELLLTVQNVRQLSESLNAIASSNSGDIAAIASNLREVSEALKLVVETTSGDVSAEMKALQAATEKLDKSLAHVEGITGGLERGEGTLGQLLKDSSTIDSVNDTLDTVNGLVGQAGRIKTEVYYRGDVYFGTDPQSALLAQNPVAGLARNGVGVRLMPSEDQWYVFEMAGHPQGNISSETHVFPEFGTSYEEVVVKPTFRMSFQIARRWGDAVLRFGLKDNTGGAGLDYYFFKDKLTVGVDLFDFAHGSYPVLDGTPNLQFNARYSPWRHIYVEAGLDSVLMGARYGYVTGYAGGGFYFDDNDLKLILAALPLSP